MIYTQGLVVGRKKETVNFTRDGKEQSFESMIVVLASETADGETITVNLTEKQFPTFEPFKVYNFPVEARAQSTKNGGAICRFYIPEGAAIQKISPATATTGGK